MSRKRRGLLVLAVIGWTGTLISQIIALRADDATEKQRWEDRRSQFLLLSSLSTNTLVWSTVYRYGKKVSPYFGD